MEIIATARGKEAMPYSALSKWCRKIEWFTARTRNIQRAVDEIDEPLKPFFSREPCEICKAGPGIRVELSAEWLETGATILRAVCLDCVYCIEHGKPAHRLIRVK
jgi:hypothetical protein